MKVCTDACVFGASVAAYLNNHQQNGVSILDIGAGTGLLSLMLAQKTTGSINAVEIDEAAFQQANENFQASPWKNRLTIFNEDALAFNPGKKYDCIVSNPPFFKGDLKSDDDKKNAAKHDTALTLEQLLKVISKNLSPAGLFAVLMPYPRVKMFIEMATEAGYFLKEQILIQHTQKHPFFRGILFFGSNKCTSENYELALKNADGNYTPKFVSLLKDYYLNL